MKKYLFGLSALALAIAFSAFTTKSVNYKTMRVRTSVATTPATYQLGGLVTEPEYWIETATSCTNSTDNYACTFQVDLDDNDVKKYTHLDGSGKLEFNYNDDFIVGGLIGDDADFVTDEVIDVIATQDGPVQYQSSPARFYQILNETGSHGTANIQESQLNKPSL